MQNVVLVVDDDGSVRAYLKAVLQSEGFRTLEAEDGELGLELLRKIGSDIDLVISDIKMPKLDGIANSVRAEFPKIPIILVSGHTDVALENQPGVEFNARFHELNISKGTIPLGRSASSHAGRGIVLIRTRVFVLAPTQPMAPRRPAAILSGITQRAAEHRPN